MCWAKSLTKLARVVVRFRRLPVGKAEKVLSSEVKLRKDMRRIPFPAKEPSECVSVVCSVVVAFQVEVMESPIEELMFFFPWR